MPQRRVGWLVFAFALAGLLPALTKRALEALDPYTLAASLQLFSLVLLLTLARALGQGVEEQRRVHGREWFRLCWASWIGVALPLLLIAHGLQTARSIQAALLSPLAIAVALGLARGRGRPLPSAAMRALALLLGAAGATTIVLAAEPAEVRACVWIALGFATMGVYARAAQAVAERHTQLRVACWTTGLSLPPLLLLATAVPSQPLPGGFANWIGLGALAIVAAASQALRWPVLTRALHPGPYSAWVGLQALVGLFAGAAVLGEDWNGATALGSAAILAGIALAARHVSLQVPGLAPRMRTRNRSRAAPPRAEQPARAAALAARAAATPPPSLAAAPTTAAPLDPAPLAEGNPAPPPATVPQAAAPPAAIRATAAVPPQERHPDPEGTHFDALHEVVRRAAARLPSACWKDLIGGAETQTTVARNRRALDELALRPRVLRDVSEIDLGVGSLGAGLRMPVVLAPMGNLAALHPEGAQACARAAARFGTAFIQCAQGRHEPAPEDADENPPPRILQLEPSGDSRWLEAQVARVIEEGYDALCLSVDRPVPGRLERGSPASPLGGFESTPDAAGLSWKQIERYRRSFQLPLVLKGIHTSQDAELACEHGVDVVYVSNCGGRQLDHARGTTAALPEIADAVSGRARIWVDGGYCRGTDIAKALALGADVVAIGRLQAYGLAAAGEDGVLRVLELLEEELRTALALCGVTRPAELDRSFVERSEPLAPPHVLSAFPQLLS